jgi:hypothetical protein
MSRMLTKIDENTRNSRNSGNLKPETRNLFSEEFPMSGVLTKRNENFNHRFHRFTQIFS